MLFLSSCGSPDAETAPETRSSTPRTFEQFDLGDPAGAVTEFAHAFRRRDFISVALILHPVTQASMTADVAAADFSTWAMPELEPAIRARIELERNGDHHLDTLRVFETAMQEATRNGGLRVDLGGGIEDVRVRTADDFTAVVDAVLSADGAPVVFELGPTADGRWRVRQARLENGIGTELPFSGQPAQVSPVRAVDVATTWRAGLPDHSPMTLLDTIETLLDQGDHVSLYLLLDAVAQREVASRLPVSTTGVHEFVAARFDEVMDRSGFPFDFSALGEGPEPPEAVTTEPGDSLTFAARAGDVDYDVTVVLDGDGNWRLRRMALIGDLASPTPFPGP